MKILSILKSTNPKELGGTETFNRMLKEMFDDIIYFFAQPVKNKVYFKVDDVVEFRKNDVLNKILKFLFGTNYPLRLALEKEKADIYILNQFGDLKLVKNIKEPCILIQHMNFNYFFGKNDEKKIETAKKKLAYFVFLSNYDKEKFIKEIDFPEDKAVVIRHTCKMEILCKNKNKNKKLIMICRLDNNHKRIDLAIKVMKKLPDFMLNIYGDGEDREYLENLIKENNLQNVFLHGGTNQVKEKLDENGIFIMTSDKEGYPITTIEAMRRGLPIVLRNTFDSAPDIVQDNGILLNSKWNENEFVEAIRKVYNNYEHYSENAIKMGNRHDFKIIKKEWEKLFNKLMIHKF